MIYSGIRLCNGVFIRHVADESVMWCPRTGGCTVMRDAKPILEEMTREWRSVTDVYDLVAAKFKCGIEDAREGVETVIGELVGQAFVEVEVADDVHVRQMSGQDICYSANVHHSSSDDNDDDEDWTPLGDFYRRHGLPSGLHIDLTDCCNEKCVHCYLPKGRAHFIDKNVACKVLKEFREAQGLTVFVSGGECMLHRDFGEILRYAKSLDLNIIVMSNLTLCDEKTVTLLKDIDPQFVNVSLYAVTESIHDAITQVPGSCLKTKTAIDTLQAAGVHIRIATPFMRENKSCVEELREFADQRHVHLIPDAEIFGQIDHTCVNQNHALSMKELQELVYTYRDVFYKYPSPLEKCEREAKVCDIGDARLNLDAEGKYYPCDGFHGAIIGDAYKDSLWDVWTGEALNKLRELRNKDFGTCASCVNRAWCKVCPMRNFNETGDMFRHAPWRCGAARIWRRTFEEESSC